MITTLLLIPLLGIILLLPLNENSLTSKVIIKKIALLTSLINLFISIIAVVPFTIFGALSVLELAVSFIQSYVFIVLTSSYIKEALESH